MRISLASVLMLIAFFESSLCVITVRNSQGKALRSDYVQQVLAETEQLMLNQNIIEGRQQKPIFNTMFVQADSQKCESDKECLNDGICYEKQCYCKTHFVGPLCQYQLSSPVEVSTTAFIIICIASVIGGILLMILINYILKMRQENKLKREGEYNDNKFEIWNSEEERNRQQHSKQ